MTSGQTLMRVSALAGLAGLVTCAAAPPPSGPVSATIADGTAQEVAEVGGTRFDLYTFRPTGCTLTGVLLVFHGVGRNARGYRDDAIPIGQRYCMLVAAPLFDKARFPSWRYQRGGIVHHQVLQSEASWTVSLVPQFADWVRERVGGPALPYALIGHSGGGQFLSRVAAYAPGQARRIVIENPSTWVEPSLATAAPYGFGAPYPPGQAAEALRRYLALPLTVVLGGQDTGSKDLAEFAQATAQGATRLQRGQNAFGAAEATAQQHNWPFNWRLAIVPGVGHTARAMIPSEPAIAALAP